MQQLTILKIAIPTPLRKVFDYLLPKKINLATLQPGMRVKVPFGYRKIVGIIAQITNSSTLPPMKLKKIIAVLDNKPVIDAALLKLCEWGSVYYHHPLGEVLFYALPRLLRLGKPAALQTIKYWCVSTTGKSLEQQRLKRAPQQTALLQLLLTAADGMSREQIIAAGFSSQTINALHKKGLITYVTKENSVIATSHSNETCIDKPGKIVLNAAQQQAAADVVARLNQFQCFLLHGVTGSGKTEVYLQVIAQVLAQGQQALILVPEISLTPQTLHRFTQRFQVLVVSIHSGLNERERLDAWLLARSGQAKVIIGTRSAIFTPFKNLGIIVVDEEHDLSFKQQDGFRYSARDLAVIRANMLAIPVILGSATPSFESLYNVTIKRYQRLHLPERAGNAVHPQFRLINVCDQRLQNGMSKELLRAIQLHLHQGNKVLLFLNRRGYAPTLMCHRCGWIAKCSKCDANMTLHSQPVYLHCHHCDSRNTVQHLCPNCQGKNLRNLGVGTEQLEMALSKNFPDVPIIRIDRDTTRRRKSLTQKLADFRKDEPQILIGTQMITKGHHFPDVTLVGIINLDQGFFSADFRAPERIGQLLIQVAGRAGRADKPGEVVLQTHHPRHPLLLQLLQQGYAGFAETALQERYDSQLPPYAYCVLIRAEALSEKLPTQFLQAIKEILLTHKKAGNEVEVLGPIPAIMLRKKNFYRVQLLLQAPRRPYLQNLLKTAIPQIDVLLLAKKVRWSIDVDPQEMG